MPFPQVSSPKHVSTYEAGLNVELQPLNKKDAAHELRDQAEDEFLDADTAEDPDASDLSPRPTASQPPLKTFARFILTSLALSRFGRWARGPLPPRPFRIKPWIELSWFDSSRLLACHKPHGRWTPHSSFYTFAIGLFVLITSLFYFLLLLITYVNGCSLEGYGTPRRLSSISRLWPDSMSCGVDGRNCQPFSNDSFAFRCPANCEGTKIWSPRFIGPTEINYRSLVVGGRTNDGSGRAIYRGDSFICGAARHAGLISDIMGGAGVVSLIGEQNGFPSVTANGIASVAFEPSFPVAFTFEEGTSNDAAMETPPYCADPRWLLFFICLFFTLLASILSDSPSFFFWVEFVIIFFCIALATDPPDHEDFNEVVSSAFQRFLPAVFVGAIVYRYCVFRTLNGLSARLEKTFLWLVPCWIGALDNFTFDRLPLQRLTPHDIQTQPGAIAVLVLIVASISIVAIGQVWALRIEGRLPRYLAFYGLVALTITVLAVLPGLKLRIHHYILALLLLPGTALQTRPSLVYQGLLVGLFLNGIARWGFASVLETSADLLGDGTAGGPVPYEFPAPLVHGINNDTLSFDWSSLANATSGKLLDAFSTVSIVVNDVERFLGSAASSSSSSSSLSSSSSSSSLFVGSGPVTSFNWTRLKPNEVEYFRVAFVNLGRLGDANTVFDYTRPATWFVNGTWKHFGD